MTIEPRSYFTLFRGLENHLDATTYYIQAVIRNGVTAALIETVNLDPNNSFPREFSKQWQAPADPNGNGVYITITYSVYTDSGYSTKSENYGDKYEEHFVQHNPIQNNGGGGVDIDYKKIQKMIDNSLANFKPVNVTETKIDIQPILKAIADNKVEMEPNEPVDFEPVTKALDFMQKDLNTLLAQPKFEKTDLKPVLVAMEGLKQIIQDSVSYPESAKKEITTMLERIKTFFDGDISDIKTEMQKLLDMFSGIQYLVPKNNEPTNEKPKEDFVTLANKQANEQL